MVELTLGAMNFGRRTPEDEARRIVDRALDAGITLLDTANVYHEGESERMLGRLVAGRRDRVRIASKVGLAPVDGKPEGLSRPRVLAAADESLRRLATDRIDVYYLHAPDRSPHPAPIEETLDALAELLRAGKILAWGVSNFASWQILELFHLCDARGMPRPAMSQVLYNLAVRQLELEYFKFTARHPIHTTVYNALAGGVLTGRHRRDAPPPAGSRFDGNAMYLRRYWTDRLFDLAAACAEVAAAEGITPTELAYAWLAGRPEVDSILLGPATVDHLEAALSGCARSLSPDALAALDRIAADFAGTDASYAR